MKHKRSSNGSSEIHSPSLLTNELKDGPTFNKKSLHCLFCYKLVDSNCTNDNEKLVTEASDQKSREIEVCLRFYKHVKLTSSTHYGKEEQTRLQQLLRVNNCAVCTNCFQVVQTHCEIHREIEYLKLRRRWQLDKIHKIMKYAGKVPSRVKAFKAKFDNLDHGGASNHGNNLTHQLEQSFVEVMGLRHDIYGACSKRLKVKNPIVVLKPLKQSNTCDENCVPRSRSKHSACFEDNDNQDSDQEIMYIFKTEDETDGTFKKIVTPPESILETLRSGDLPMEGVSKNHYFYCTPASSLNCEEDLVSNTRPTRSGLASPVGREDDKETNAAAAGHLEAIPNSLSKKSTGIYKCIKCAQMFFSEQLLICHAKEGNCFTDENINLSYSSSISGNQKKSLTPKRWQSSKENLAEQSANKRRRQTCEENEFVLDLRNEPANKAIATPPSGTRSGNVLSNAIDKILLDLGSTFKCPNCNAVFHSQEKYKGHVMSRACFREIKKRSSTSTSKNLGSYANDENESDSDASSSTASSQEENSDSDYAPEQGAKRVSKSKKVNRKSRSSSGSNNGVGEEKEMVKAKCPKDGCTKFFLYKKDLERHLNQHSISQMSCQFCPFTTNLASEIANHEIQKHSKKNSDGDILCPRCSSTKILKASDKHGQTDHYMKRHLTVETGTTLKRGNHVTAQCKICGVVLRAKSSSLVDCSLKRHVKNVHKK